MGNSLQLKCHKKMRMDVYLRISKGIPYDEKLKIYSKKLVLETLEYFEDKEDYEKCEVISNFIKLRFDHLSHYLM